VRSSVCCCILQYVLRFVAVCCSVVYWESARVFKGNGELFIEGACCGVLQCVAVCAAGCVLRRVLRFVLRCVAVRCVVLQCVAVLYAGRVPQSSTEMVSGL